VWYDNKITKMLDNKEIYKHLETNATVSTTKDVNKVVDNFARKQKDHERSKF